MADTSLTENKIGLLIWQVSNYWQSKLRKILKNHNLSLNEYLLMASIKKLMNIKKEISQIDIANFSGIDVSVASVTFKLLEDKKLVMRDYKNDNRKKNVILSSDGKNLFNIIFSVSLESFELSKTKYLLLFCFAILIKAF